MSQMLNLKAKIFVIINFVLLSMFASAPLTAGLVQSLYDFDIAVIDESADTRQAAFTQGLNEMFVRISGDSAIMRKLKRPPSSRYVQQFSYLPIETPVITAEGEVLNHQLKIQYNGKRMEKYLLENGFSVWSEHRSDVVVWLAIRDGQNEYVLKDADSSLLKTTMDEALARRGVPRRWPLNDYKDQKHLKVADIRGGFKDPLNKASKRYGNGPVLAGSMIWNGQQWQSSWSLLMASTEQYWSLVDSDYTKLIDKSVNTAADTMGHVYAINNASGGQQLATLLLDVQAVNSIDKYRRVENYLKNLSAANSAFPVFADGQKAVFQITLRSEEKDFLNLINNDAELVKVKVVEPPAAKEMSTGEASGKTDKAELNDNTVTADAVTQFPDSQLSDASTTDLLADPLTAELPSTEPQLPTYYYRLLN